MVFKPLIPQPTDFISQSQRDMLGNFTDASDIWGKLPQQNENVGDHIPLTNPQENERGGHKKVTLIEQDPIPAAAANEAVLYSEESGGNTELFYRRNADLTGNQLTSNGGLSPGGLVLRAYALFDQKGKVIESDGLDDEGNPIKVPMSFNIQSINQVTADRDEWLITFSRSLGTDNYFWIVQNFAKPFSAGKRQRSTSQPSNKALYGDSITATSFLFMNAGISGVNPPDVPAIDLGRRMIFQAYTVI